VRRIGRFLGPLENVNCALLHWITIHFAGFLAFFTANFTSINRINHRGPPQQFAIQEQKLPFTRFTFSLIHLFTRSLLHCLLKHLQIQRFHQQAIHRAHRRQRPLQREDLHGSTVTTNGSASAGYPGFCTIARMLNVLPWPGRR